MIGRAGGRWFHRQSAERHRSSGIGLNSTSRGAQMPHESQRHRSNKAFCCDLHHQRPVTLALSRAECQLLSARAPITDRPPAPQRSRESVGGFTAARCRWWSAPPRRPPRSGHGPVRTRSTSTACQPCRFTPSVRHTPKCGLARYCGRRRGLRSTLSSPIRLVARDHHDCPLSRRRCRWRQPLTAYSRRKAARCRPSSLVSAVLRFTRDITATGANTHV